MLPSFEEFENIDDAENDDKTLTVFQLATELTDETG